MYKIGEFSIISKTTVKALRYYEKEELLIPSFIDTNNGYRYYETSQLIDFAHIIALRQIGFSIKDIKELNNTSNTEELLINRKKEIIKEINIYKDQLSRINYLLEEKNMNYEVIIKKLPEYTVYYKEGIIKDFSEITNFILSSAEECLKINPSIKCIEPDYCFVNYLDKEYKDKNIRIRYSQAVIKEGISNENIKFEQLKSIDAVCIYHKGSYRTLGNAYGFIFKWIEENGYEVIDSAREHYIDGMWNKEDENDWLTEIQVPIRKK